MKEKT